MLLEEGTFDAPPVVDFSFLAHEYPMEVSGNADSSRRTSHETTLALGRDTAITYNLNSMEKLAECLHSISSGTTAPLLC